MKHQFAELLSTIGFITSGISSRRLDKAGKFGTDGIESLIGKWCSKGPYFYYIDKILAIFDPPPPL